MLTDPSCIDVFDQLQADDSVWEWAPMSFGKYDINELFVATKFPVVFNFIQSLIYM